MTTENPQYRNRSERVLAFMAFGVVLLCVVAFAVVVISGIAGVGADVMNGQFYSLLKVLPLVGLPIAFILILVVSIIGIRRRRRELADEAN